VFSCLHAVTSEKGCGTTVFCRFCGRTRAEETARTNGAATCELRMLRQVDGRLGAADLRLTSRRLLLDGEIYSVLALADVSDEKRRESLERTFLHDLLNSANVLKGVSWAIGQGERGEEVLDLLRESVDQLVEEIRVQRMLTRAESGELEAEPERVEIAPLLEGVARQYRSHLVAQERQIAVGSVGVPLFALTDAVLLRRVIGNLVKNALEATEPGETVTLACHEAGGRIRIEVHDPAAMPDEVRLQLFNRSFTTKGPGRGIGTYSVKLLTERYLDGTVEVGSSPDAGTSFFVSLPGA
jgi:signal transduction histidine kinase